MMKKSYFKDDILYTKIEKLKENRDCPSWLVHTLSKLGENIDKFPYDEDETRYTVEYIYPH